MTTFALDDYNFVKLVDQPLPGVALLEPKVFTDHRGDFVKTYNQDMFQRLGLNFLPSEEFFSTSQKNVVRGMHFQLPPHDHAKLVYCIRGRVLDVLLDLRKSSPTYRKYVSAELSAINKRMYFIPTGIAHGFLSLENDSVMIYKTSTGYNPACDSGIQWKSFGFEWGVPSPIISARDEAFPHFSDFTSPF